ncbi:hypothetical protein [Kitasatospora sp. GP82]|uniref:COG4705 family protein n=1 Tax=Kitasatospora sp. GP82 TaxID=3035089 RepID=UPI00247700F6|nr:hypothetical protein [Kitasatospora sp. GP82]MDH6126520.1 putative membrane-anchored protein [Kitasatospora sp. GP82]
MNKLPRITLAFWVMKICATTLGETAGDLVSMTLKVGYAASSVILVGLFLVSVVAQLRGRTFHPVLYWTVILTTSTAGTTMSDLMNRTAGLGYTMGALVLGSALAVVFVVWKLCGQTFDVEHIGTFKGEMLYWSAILLSNTLGTSTGDFLADTSGLGFAGGTLLITGLLALIVIAKHFSPVSNTLLFWMAFVLTRPFGANAGDFFSKPTRSGGLGFGPLGASLVLAAILIALILYTVRRQRRDQRPGAAEEWGRVPTTLQ